MDPTFFNSSNDNYSQDIKDFLSKPVIMATGNFTNTDTYSTFPEFLSPNNVLNVASLMSDKVRGYFGFRATLVLRLVVNANRFQQGRYNLQYYPTGGVNVTATSTSRHRLNAQTSTLVQRTQLPHVELDLACDTEATLRIPFNNALNFFPFRSNTVSNGFGAFGIFKIYPYSALVSPTGSTTCGYTLWANFEDIVLIGSAAPQSGRGFSSSVRSKNETDVEQATSGMGPISSSLMRLKKVSDIFTDVPLLSSYANMTSWYSEMLAGVASSFGWSKPVNLEHSLRITQNYLPYSANVDAPDQSFPLSFSYKNQVGKAMGFSGTDLDEMDFQFLCTIPTYFTTIPWSTQVTGTQLALYPLRPLANLVTRTVTGRTVTDAAPYQFVANFFRNWRGSMVFKLKLVKTEFHSGRLMISFSPYATPLNGVGITTSNASYLHRQIIDIRDCNEFTFAVPFLSNQPYKDKTEAFGDLFIHVLDPLVAPSSVSDTISIIVEICMGPDAEFCVPDASNMQPVYNISPQSGAAFVSEESNVCANFRGMIGSTSYSNDSTTNSLFCVGEKISSLRTLFKLPSVVVPNVIQTTNLYFNIIPFAIPYVYYNTATPAYVDPNISCDLYGLISSLYLYSRGGVRLKYIDNLPVTQSEPFVIYMNSSITNSTLLVDGFQFAAADGNNASGPAARAAVPNTYYKAGYSGEVQIPQYGRLHSRLVTCQSCNTNSFGYDYSIGAAPDIFVSRTTVPSVTNLATVVRSASDDANLGFFLAVPPLLFF